MAYSTRYHSVVYDAFIRDVFRSPYMEQILKPFMTKEMERIGAAIEVVMDVFIDRLQGYSGTVVFFPTLYLESMKRLRAK